MSTAIPPVIRVHGLNHYFGAGEARKQVLCDNHLSVMPGEVVIMTGKSGSGKTTLLTLIGALRTVQEGGLQVLGRDLAQLGPAALVAIRRGIGFIFQAHNLFDSLTAHQNVCMGLQLGRWSAAGARQRAVELLTDLGLGERLHYKPNKLSGGQRQRVAIARALGNRPKLILADEPTAALDEESGAKVVELLQKMANEEGTAVLIVTHDNRILQAADRIVNMSYGKIISNVQPKVLAAICVFLRNCPAFTALDVDALTRIAEKMTRETFEPGTRIIRQGDVGEKFYLIRSGTVDVVVNEGRPDEAWKTPATEGDFFGEMALLRGQPRAATVISRDHVEAYTLDKASFLAAVAANESLKDQVYKIVFSRQ